MPPRRRKGKPATRDYDDSRYVEWRREVRRRAGKRCQLCGSRCRLECHHLARWADAPQSRFDPLNGCLLCKRCHERVTGKEGVYHGLLANLIGGGDVLNAHIRYLMEKYGKGKKDGL